MKRTVAVKKVAASILLGGFCLWLAMRKAELTEVSRALHDFDPF